MGFENPNPYTRIISQDKLNKFDLGKGKPAGNQSVALAYYNYTKYKQAVLSA